MAFHWLSCLTIKVLFKEAYMLLAVATNAIILNDLYIPQDLAEYTRIETSVSQMFRFPEPTPFNFSIGSKLTNLPI